MFSQTRLQTRFAIFLSWMLILSQCGSEFEDKGQSAEATRVSGRRVTSVWRTDGFMSNFQILRKFFWCLITVAQYLEEVFLLNLRETFLKLLMKFGGKNIKSFKSHASQNQTEVFTTVRSDYCLWCCGFALHPRIHSCIVTQHTETTCKSCTACTVCLYRDSINLPPNLL